MKRSNTKNSQTNSTYFKAKEKVQELKSFYFSLVFYGIVNAGLIYIWYAYSGTDFQWFWFPVIGWGIGLLFKAFNVYDIDFVFGKQWEDRKLNQLMHKGVEVENAVVEENKAYQTARKKVDSIKGFYSHLMVYLIVNIFIVIAIVWNTNIKLLSFSALSTALFWGIGLASHAIGVFGEDIFFDKNWEERKIQKIMDADQDTYRS